MLPGHVPCRVRTCCHLTKEGTRIDSEPVGADWAGSVGLRAERTRMSERTRISLMRSHSGRARGELDAHPVDGSHGHGGPAKTQRSYVLTTPLSARQIAE